jgi:hypothetical protein
MEMRNNRITKNNFNNPYKTKLNAIEYVYIQNSYKRLQKLQG